LQRIVGPGQRGQPCFLRPLIDVKALERELLPAVLAAVALLILALPDHVCHPPWLP